MNGITIYLLVVGSLTGPIAASADSITLDYQGATMTGSSFYLPASCAPGACDLSRAPVTGNYDISIVLNGSLAANDLSLVSVNMTVNGNNGIPGLNPGILPAATFAGAPSGSSGTLFQANYLNNLETVQLTTNNGKITGAEISFPVPPPIYGPTIFESIGSNGDAYGFSDVNQRTGCNPIFPGQVINPCIVYMSNAIAGIWNVIDTPGIGAPEIDPSSAASGLTLLFCGLAVLRGRRSVPMSRALK